MAKALMPGQERLLNRHRLGRLGSFASTQVLVQALGFATGLLLVRHMSVQDYGWFTLAMAGVAVGGVLVDLGLSMGAMALGGRIGGRQGALSEVIFQARRLQLRMAAWILPLLGVGVALLLWRQQAPAGYAALLALLVAVTVGLNARSALALVLVRLLGRVPLQQRLDLFTQGARLLAVMGLAYAAAHWLNAACAMLLTLATAAAYAAVLQGFTRVHAPAPALPDPALHRAELLASVWKQAPNSLYFVVSSQVAVGLIAFFGQTQNVAEVGALGRLSALFTLTGAVTAALVLPYFAKRQAVQELEKGLCAVNLFFASLLVALLLLALLVPGLVLWMLGGNYQSLHAELPWLLASGTLGAWGGTLYSIGCARGWVLPAAWSAPAGLLVMSGVALSVDLSSVRGVLMVNASATATLLVLVAGYLAYHLRGLRAAPLQKGPQ